MINHGEVEIIIDNVLQSTQGEGGSFGELALIHGCPRAATVRVSTLMFFCSSIFIPSGAYLLRLKAKALWGLKFLDLLSIFV